MKSWRQVREEMMSTDPGNTGKAGFSSKANDEGPVAGYDKVMGKVRKRKKGGSCLLYTSPSPRDMRRSRMPSSA